MTQSDLKPKYMELYSSSPPQIAPKPTARKIKFRPTMTHGQAKSKARRIANMPGSPEGIQFSVRRPRTPPPWAAAPMDKRVEASVLRRSGLCACSVKQTNKSGKSAQNSQFYWIGL